MMARKTRTSRSKKSCDSLIKMRLDVSRGPLDLRSWPESQVTTATITAHGRTLPGRRTRLRISRVHDSRRSGTITDGRAPRRRSTPICLPTRAAFAKSVSGRIREIKARCAESRLLLTPRHEWHRGQRKAGNQHLTKEGCRLAQNLGRLAIAQAELETCETRFNELEG